MIAYIRDNYPEAFPRTRFQDPCAVSRRKLQSDRQDRYQANCAPAISPKVV